MENIEYNPIVLEQLRVFCNRSDGLGSIFIGDRELDYKKLFKDEIEAKTNFEVLLYTSFERLNRLIRDQNNLSEDEFNRFFSTLFPQ